MEKHYRNTKVNPCNMCMPMGGILAFKGVERSMVLIHGSQGCATYMRRHIAEHFNEPLDVASSSLNEKGTVYGGEGNFKKGLDNVIRVYDPAVIGVLTTCLAETIGEDIERMALSYLQERGLDNLPVVTVPTPGYGDSHSEGYWLAVQRIVTQLARPTAKHNRINIFVPNISPADIREIKRILGLMNIEYTLLPDISDSLDRPMEKSYQRIPDGGTRLADIAALPGAMATIQMGLTVQDSVSPGRFLETEFGVPLYNLPIPMGVESTDCFLRALSEISGNPVPESLKLERGRLLDAMIDSHKHNFQGRAVVFGEPEQVHAVTMTCLENGIYPAVVATGGKGGKLAELIEASVGDERGEVKVLNETDFTVIRKHAVEAQANIAIGPSDGRYLEEREGIPLVRFGFPIHDRVGGQRILSVGYLGTTMFLDRITNTLLENKYKNYRKKLYREFYRGGDWNELRLVRTNG